MATKTPTDAELKSAEEHGQERAKLPTALTSATLDEEARAVRLRFRAGIELAIPIKAIGEIAKVPIAHLRDVKASPIGDGLIFDRADVGIYVPGLLRDLFGGAFAGGARQDRWTGAIEDQDRCRAQERPQGRTATEGRVNR